MLLIIFKDSMSNTVFVIDSNPTIQAIASLALSQLGVTLHPITNPQVAREQAALLKPDLVFCTKDLTSIDSFSLCGLLKSAQPGLRIVMLAPADSEQQISEQVTKAGIDEVLYKPFKSEQLRLIAKRLLSESEIEAKLDSAFDTPSKQVSVIVSSGLLRRAIGKMLDRYGFAVNYFITWADALKSRTASDCEATFVDYIEPDTASKEIDEKHWGSVYMLLPPGMTIPEGAQKYQLLARPLSTHQIEEICVKLSEQAAITRPAEKGTLTAAEQAVLAAKISANVYERLLTQPALRERDWDRVGDAAREEALRICRRFGSVLTK
jgi:CheY-like chemotaxis protein